MHTKLRYQRSSGRKTACERQRRAQLAQQVDVSLHYPSAHSRSRQRQIEAKVNTVTLPAERAQFNPHQLTQGRIIGYKLQVGLQVRYTALYVARSVLPCKADRDLDPRRNPVFQGVKSAFAPQHHNTRSKKSYFTSSTVSRAGAGACYKLQYGARTVEHSHIDTTRVS
ncbi:hypothetical protein RRG08_053952 [Elysia crispata]|uniref:Uncharacterized protein n=1 Tax=Elysia crispata TaxID=231223 RepID=A0AAE0ZE95_9GAST|nr:hypothetical protein RRG08_053952 [Elysia crispata]